MPPRSMKAPKSVMFLTTPSRTCPLIELLDDFPAQPLALLLEHRAARDDDVAARLVELDDLEIELLPQELVEVLDLPDVDLGAGQESLDPRTGRRTIPPLIRRISFPFTVVPASWESLISSQTRMKSAFCLESTTLPSRSSTFSRKTSTSLPMAIVSGSENSLIGMAPSDLKPMSTSTSWGWMPTTRPFTISPSFLPEKLSSYIAVNSCICSSEYSGVSRSSIPDVPVLGFFGAAGNLFQDNRRCFVRHDLFFSFRFFSEFRYAPRSCARATMRSTC